MNIPETRQALFDAIRDEPDADAPRLIYADFLEEHSSERGDLLRAEFIRVQIEREQVRVKMSDPETSLWAGGQSRYLHERAWKILNQGWELWHRPFHPTQGACRAPSRSHLEVEIGGVAWRWERGFLAHVAPRLHTWLECGRALVAGEMIHSLQVTDKEPWHIGPVSWGWMRSSALGNTAAVLPDEIFYLTRGYSGISTPDLRGGREDIRWWGTREDAIDALHAACLAFATPSRPQTKTRRKV